MAKSYEDKGYFGQRKFVTQQAEQLGLNMDDYNLTDGRGAEFNVGKKDFQDLERDVAAAMSRSYDHRESLAAGKSAGNKRFEDLGHGVSNISEAFALDKAMKSVHKKDLGNGGKFSSANDYANVTRSLVADKDQAMEDSIMSKTQSLLDEHMAKAKGSTEEETPRAPIQHSERMQASKDLLANTGYGLMGSRLHGSVTNDYSFTPKGISDPFDTRANEVGAIAPKTLELSDGKSPGTEDIVSDSKLDNTNEKAAFNFKDDYAFRVAGALNSTGTPTRGPGTKFGA